MGYTSMVDGIIRAAAEDAPYLWGCDNWENYPARFRLSDADEWVWRRCGDVEVHVSWDSSDYARHECELELIVYPDGVGGKTVSASSKDASTWPLLDLMWPREDWQRFVVEQAADWWEKFKAEYREAYGEEYSDGADD